MPRGTGSGAVAFEELLAIGAACRSEEYALAVVRHDGQQQKKGWGHALVQQHPTVRGRSQAR